MKCNFSGYRMALIHQQRAAESYWIGDYKTAGQLTTRTQQLIIASIVIGLIVMILLLISFQGAA